MANMQFSRTQKCCLLCKHWNGTIGSTTIKIVRGGWHSLLTTARDISVLKKAAE